MRAPNWGKDGLKRGEWSPEEDEKLIAYITRYGIWNWGLMPRFAGLSRTGKSCRLRWMNYLRPGLKHGNMTEEEKKTIISMHEKLGNRWAAIAATLPGRTDNEIKNYWHSHLKIRLDSQEPVVPRRSKALKINIPDSEADVKSADESVIKPEASVSANYQTYPSMSAPSTAGFSNVSIVDEESHINSMENFDDFQAFWTVPALDGDIRYDFPVFGEGLTYASLPSLSAAEENLYAENNSNFLEELYGNHEYWLDHLFQSDWYQMRQYQPN